MKNNAQIANDVLEKVKKYSRTRGVSMSAAIVELIQRGLHTPIRTRIVNGFHVVDLPLDSPRVDSSDVKRLQD
jgi:hypothetical protein